MSCLGDSCAVVLFRLSLAGSCVQFHCPHLHGSSHGPVAVGLKVKLFLGRTSFPVVVFC